MQPITINFGPLEAADPESIVTTTTISEAGALILDGYLVSGGVAYISTPCELSMTSDADDSALIFTIIGKDQDGRDITYVMPEGPNIGEVTSEVTFSVITSIIASGASAGNISIGNAERAHSRVIALDPYAAPYVMYSIGGSGTYSVNLEGAVFGPNSGVFDLPQYDWPWNTNNSPISSEAGSNLLTSTWVPQYIRIFYTGTGNGRFTVMQFGSVSK